MTYLPKDYIPKGDLEGFPEEVIEKMIEKQVEQGNPADVGVFEECSDRIKGDFSWPTSIEGFYFWHDVILYRNFTLFFERYPKADEITEEALIELGFEDLTHTKISGYRKCDSDAPYWLEVNSKFRVTLLQGSEYNYLPNCTTLTDLKHLIRILGI